MSKSSSLPVPQFDSRASQFDPLDPLSSETTQPDWKQEVNQRLAAHRTRRNSAPEASDRQRSESPRVASARAAEAAAKVAARYANAPSYNQLLASEARAVVRAAGAAAEAARDAQAAAEAVLAGLQSAPLQSVLWQPAPQSTPQAAPPAAYSAPASSTHIPAPRWQDEPPAEEAPSSQWAGAQPRWEETLPITAPPPVPPRNEPVRDVWAEMRVHSLDESQNSYHYSTDEGELFPPDAVLSATVEPVQHLPANLIEFPRELIASRKARPRLAEGPFYNPAQDSPQLSIFEVDPELLAPPLHLNAAHPEIAPPEWASIELDHHPEPDYDRAPYDQTFDQAYNPARNPARNPAYDQAPAAIAQEHPHVQAYAQTVPPDTQYEEASAAGTVDFVDFYPAEAYSAPAVPRRETVRETIRETATNAVPAPAVELLVAPMSDRLLASVVDAALVTLAYLVAAVVVIASTAHPPTGRIALIASACGLAIFSLLYQFLFLSFAEEGTLGMRYARIALCTFDDDNPTREQMQMRIPAMLVSALPLGLGLAWAIFDREHLAWHDRMTKTYQRKY